MAVEITVPAAGESVSEADIGEWLKNEGDYVEADEPVVTLETDKASMDVPAPAAGVLKGLKAKAGDTVAVGDVIAIIEEGAAKSNGGAGASSSEAPKSSAPAASSGGGGPGHGSGAGAPGQGGWAPGVAGVCAGRPRGEKGIHPLLPPDPPHSPNCVPSGTAVGAGCSTLRAVRQTSPSLRCGIGPPARALWRASQLARARRSRALSHPSRQPKPRALPALRSAPSSPPAGGVHPGQGCEAPPKAACP